MGGARLELNSSLEHGLAEFALVTSPLEILDVLGRADKPALTPGLVLLAAKESSGQLESKQKGVKLAHMKSFSA